MRCVTRLSALVVAMLLALAPVTAQGQGQVQSDESATERLLRILVKNGVVTREQADGLAKQARDEARAARVARPAATVAAAQAGAAPVKPVAPNTVRVTYVPETVRRQIAAEVKQQVMQQATEEGWAEPNTIPSWTQRVRVTGDVRVRGEANLFAKSNYNAFPDFNTINQSSNGYDATSGVNPPLLNTTENRFRPRLRARLGVEAQLADWATAEFRVATGNDRSPVSTNQTLGSGGDFSKYALWLDRANIVMKPIEDLTIYAGRFANPFWTSDLLFDDELNMDGVALKGTARATDTLSGFLVLGGFPVFNTDFNFGTTNLAKTASRDSWLTAVQAGADWKPFEKPYSARLAIGYFGFQNVDGKTSNPCVSPTSYGSCSTDSSRAPWVQFGNTMFPIRNITATNGSSTPQPQYYGLASTFGVIDTRVQMTYTGFHPIDIRPEADFVVNLAFNKNTIAARSPVNNIGSTNNFLGSNTGYALRVALGHLALNEPYDWNVTLAYKYLGSDAVVDALTDSRFHNGGTNAKGFVLSGNFALAKNLWLSGLWTSTNAVSGPPYASDSVFFDLNARF